MPRITKDKQIENLLVAQAMFADIPNRNIDLGWWRFGRVPLQDVVANPEKMNHCGSTGCFGGWIAVHPHFREQGVRPDEDDGHPVMGSQHSPSEISERLFGCPGMFHGHHWATNFSTSDRAEIEARIRFALDYLTKA